MKKLVVSILAIVYFVSSTGATVQLHYCMDKLVSWEISGKRENKCPNCGMEKQGHGGCCKDEQKFLKNTDDQKVSEAAIQLMNGLITPLPVISTDSTEFYTSSIIENYPICHAPPIISGTDILVRNCIFRI